MPEQTDVNRPRRWPAVAAVTAAVVLIVVHLFVPSQVTYLTVSIGAAVAAWIGAARRSRPSRRLGYAIASGVAFTALGDLIFAIYELANPEVPDVTVADLAWVVSYVGIALALFGMLAGGRRRIDVDGMIDMAAVLVVVLVFEWEAGWGATATDASLSVVTRVTWLAYPALDAVMLALVAHVLVRRAHAGWMFRLVAPAAVCWLVADYGFMLNPDEFIGTWLDAGWLLGAVFFAASTWHDLAVAERPAPTQRRPVGRIRLGLGLLPVLLPAALEVLGLLRGRHTSHWPMLLATLLLFGLCFARGERMLRSEWSARAELRSRERYANALAETSSDAVMVVDRHCTILNDAAKAAALVGVPGADIRGHDAREMVRRVDFDAVTAVFERSLVNPGRVFDHELQVRHVDGRVIWVEARIVSRLDDPDVRGVVINLHDITDRRRAQDELARQAFHDSLTGLANRALFANRVEHALRRPARGLGAPAVIYLDLDGFKTVNDSLGHEAGDLLLREVADRLLTVVRADDTVARLGGDEFGILIEGAVRPADEAAAIADRVQTLLTAPVMVFGRPVVVSASLGLAVADENATASSLLCDADIAMYHAKTGGRARWALYDGEMRKAAVERLELETDLVGALEAGQLRLLYQPVVDLATDEVVGFEALLRWEHPRLGLVSPDRFIPIAEDTGLIVPIGGWVLDTACREARAWQQQFPRAKPLTIAVNVSARQLRAGALVHQVARALEASGLPPETLVLEMTESVLVDDPITSARRLQDLRGLGIRLAIDDFGTGYSSLSYLRQFPVDILKIDRSFVATITSPEGVPPLVRGLLDLAHTLELETVAEGIDGDVQRTSLRDQRCTLGQGYLFARPMPADEAELLLVQLDDGPITSPRA